MATDEIKGFARFFYFLGFPGGLITAAGCFSFGIGLWRGDVALSNKYLALGVFLFSLGVFLQHLPRAFGFYLMEDLYANEDDYFPNQKPRRRKVRTYFSFRDFIGLLAYGALLYFSGRHLWFLVHQ